MMIYPLLILFAIVFYELCMFLQISKDAREIIIISRESMRVLASLEIGDDERETFMRRGSADIFKSTCRFAVKFLSIGLVLYLLFLLTVTQFTDLRQAMLDGLVSPVVIATLTAAIVCYALARRAIRSRLRNRA